MTLLSLLLLSILTTPETPSPGATTHPAAALRVEMETVDGTTLEGRLQSIDPSGTVVLIGKDSQQTLALDDLTSINVLTFDEKAAPDLDANCTLYLADGGVLAAKLLDGAASAITVDIGVGNALKVPLSGLAAVRFDKAAKGPAFDEFNARLKDRDKDRDLLLVVREGKTVVLPGALESLVHDSWSFRIGNKVQTGALDRAFGVILGGPVAAPESGRSMVSLDAQRRVFSNIRSADADRIDLDAGPLGKLSIPWRQVRGIAIRSERVVYVSGMEPVSTSQRSIYDASWPPRMDQSVMGGPIAIAGRTFDRGIGVHATSTLTYDLGGAFDSFVTTIGIDDAAGPRGRAVFRVICDGKVAYESSPISQGVAEAVRVPLGGVKIMTLECNPGPDLDISDHCDWAGARLIRAKRSGHR